MSGTDDLAFTPALEQARMVRAGDVSPVELTELYLERIERLNPQLGAYVTVASEFARDEAVRAEKARDGDGTDAPFHGVPISIKDLNDTAGIRTTAGTAAWADRIPDHDDEVVARIKRAGFVILGKTNTPEFGPLNVSETLAYPPGRNPWDPTRSCGGSSGGATRPRSRPVSARSRRAPMEAVRSATRPPGAARSASNPRVVASRMLRGRCNTSASTARWAVPSPTPPRCSTSWPATWWATPTPHPHRSARSPRKRRASRVGSGWRGTRIRASMGMPSRGRTVGPVKTRPRCSRPSATR